MGLTDDMKAWLAKLGVGQAAPGSGDAGTTASGDNSALPTIWVTPKADGSFVINGTAFLANAAVHIRIVDDNLNNAWFDTTADTQGKFTFPTGNVCAAGGNRHFSANDGRPNPKDLTGTLWSNTVTESCPAQGGDGSDGDDGGDGGDGGTDGGGSDGGGSDGGGSGGGGSDGGSSDGGSDGGSSDGGSDGGGSDGGGSDGE